MVRSPGGPVQFGAENTDMAIAINIAVLTITA
jgi:hypothetical protein